MPNQPYPPWVSDRLARFRSVTVLLVALFFWSLCADAGTGVTKAPPSGGGRGGEGLLRCGEGGEAPLDRNLAFRLTVEARRLRWS